MLPSSLRLLQSGDPLHHIDSNGLETTKADYKSKETLYKKTSILSILIHMIRLKVSNINVCNVCIIECQIAFSDLSPCDQAKQLINLSGLISSPRM